LIVAYFPSLAINWANSSRTSDYSSLTWSQLNTRNYSS
jgi:hypothetical protein